MCRPVFGVTVSAICGLCGRLVAIRVVRVDGFRYVYRPHYHDNGNGEGCSGKEIR